MGRIRKGKVMEPTLAGAAVKSLNVWGRGYVMAIYANDVLV